MGNELTCPVINSTISDERGQELLYAGMRISDVFKEDIGIGGVVSLLWFKRRLPAYACKVRLLPSLFEPSKSH